MTKAHGPQAGFTLLELMVAAALTAIVMTGLYASYAALLDVSQAADRAGLAQAGRIVMERLRDDLACIYFPLGQKAGDDSFAFVLGTGEPEETEDTGPSLGKGARSTEVLLDLVVADGLDYGGGFPEDGLWRVQYVLRTFDWGGKRHTLVRKDKPLATLDQDGTPWRELVLSESVIEWEMGCTDNLGTEKTEWDSSGSESAEALRLPRSVTLNFTLGLGIPKKFASIVEMPWQPHAK